jgi:SAM-dependent methyltransferase
MICPVCGNACFSAWGRVNNYIIERCQGCGLGITSPFPEHGERVAVNQETYLLEKRINTYFSRYMYFKKRYRRQIRNIHFFKSRGKLLDIGCNIGLFLNEARMAGFDTTGVELNNACAEYARTHFELEVHSDYLNNIAFEATSFEVVTLYDVLEHIPDLRGILADIRKILAPNGLLVVQSPNLDSLMAELAKSTWSWLSPPDHLFHFTPGSLCSLIEQSGYSILQVKTWEPVDAFCDDVMRARLGNSLPAKIARTLIRLTGLALALVTLMKKTWWRKQKGALIEVYAVKTTSYPTANSSKIDMKIPNDL